MPERLFREYVFTLYNAGATEEVHDVSGIMQDIAPRRGFKVYEINWYCSTDDAPATDESEVYVNAIKNISEAAHHVDPSATGTYTDIRVDGVIFSDFHKFPDATHQVSSTFKHSWLTKPITFDANDRLNLELTWNNLDAAAGKVIIRMFIDVEI